MNNPYSEEQMLAVVQRTLVNVLGCTQDELGAEVALSNDLDADSLDFVDLRYNLEKQLSLLLPQKSVLDHLETATGQAELVLEQGRLTPLAAYALQHSQFAYSPQQVSAGMLPMDVMSIATVGNWASLCHGIFAHLPHSCPDCNCEQAEVAANGKAACVGCGAYLKPRSGDEVMAATMQQVWANWQQQLNAA
jgi:acyl carrier protein